MGRSGGVWVKGSLAAGVMLALAASTAYADEAATKRLSKFGKLSGAQANRVASTVSTRMKRAADMTGATDPLRMAVSSALFGAPVPADQMAAAKVRLRLYAGLNEWALDNLFTPRPGAVNSCSSSYGLSSKECEALLAAGGKTSLADAARQGGGASAPPVMAAGPQPAYGQPQPQYGYAQRPQQPAQGSRFGRYDSGFRPAAQPQPAYAQQPAYGQPAARPAAGYGYGQPAARPMAARPAPAAVAPPPNPALAANRKAEYERKRQEYLERKKAEMAARKSKIVATAGGTDRVAPPARPRPRLRAWTRRPRSPHPRPPRAPPPRPPQAQRLPKRRPPSRLPSQPSTTSSSTACSTIRSASEPRRQ